MSCTVRFKPLLCRLWAGRTFTGIALLYMAATVKPQTQTVGTVWAGKDTESLRAIDMRHLQENQPCVKSSRLVPVVQYRHDRMILKLPIARFNGQENNASRQQQRSATFFPTETAIALSCARATPCQAAASPVALCSRQAAALCSSASVWEPCLGHTRLADTCF